MGAPRALLTGACCVAALFLSGCPNFSLFGTTVDDGGAPGPPGPVGPSGPPGAVGPQGPAGNATLGSSVLAFAADPSGATDATAAFTGALQAAAAAGGGTVWVPVGRYRFSGVLTIPAHVTLSGTVVGPFDPSSDPSLTTLAPTLLVLSQGAPFLTLGGVDASVANLLFDYPAQLPPEGTTPVVYPATVMSVARIAGNKVLGCTFVNSYDAIAINSGRAYLEHLNVGALHVGIAIDQATDFVHLSHITSSVFWDTAVGQSSGTPLDAWVAANSTGLVVQRADSLTIEDFSLSFRHTGIALLSSAAGAPYGRASDVDLDQVTNGIVAQATNPLVGFRFTNLDVGAVNGQSAGSAIALQAGGSATPIVGWSSGSVRGTWAGGTVSVPVGALSCSDILGAASATSCP